MEMVESTQPHSLPDEVLFISVKCSEIPALGGERTGISDRALLGYRNSMAIDGIGRPRIGDLPSPAASEAPASELGKGASSLEKLDRGTIENPEVSALERGELSVDQYLDQQVASAAQHLEGRLSAEQLTFIKESLRASLETDPVLMELVKRVTGGLAAELK